MRAARAILRIARDTWRTYREQVQAEREFARCIPRPARMSPEEEREVLQRGIRETREIAWSLMSSNAPRSMVNQIVDLHNWQRQRLAEAWMMEPKSRF